MTNDQEFDELLDQALSEYREAEPLAGIEERIFARLQTQTIKRRYPRWIGGVIAACAALALIAVWIGKEAMPTEEREVRHPIQTEHVASGEVQADPLPPVRQARRTIISAQRQTMPKQFPSPMPLTSEERAFAEALSRQSAAPVAAPQTDHDVIIAAIEIQPLSRTETFSGDNR